MKSGSDANLILQGVLKNDIFVSVIQFRENI